MIAFEIILCEKAAVGNSLLNHRFFDCFAEFDDALPEVIELPLVWEINYNATSFRSSWFSLLAKYQ